jgi:hypothetical protein
MFKLINSLPQKPNVVNFGTRVVMSGYNSYIYQSNVNDINYLYGVESSLYSNMLSPTQYLYDYTEYRPIEGGITSRIEIGAQSSSSNNNSASIMGSSVLYTPTLGSITIDKKRSIYTSSTEQPTDKDVIDITSLMLGGLANFEITTYYPSITTNGSIKSYNYYRLDLYSGLVNQPICHAIAMSTYPAIQDPPTNFPNYIGSASSSNPLYKLDFSDMTLPYFNLALTVEF